MHLGNISASPSYLQIRERLRSELKQREQGDSRSVEAELQKRFRIRRTAVGYAVEELVAEAFFLRQLGPGTFLHRPRLSHRLSLITIWTGHRKRLSFAPKRTHRKRRQEAVRTMAGNTVGVRLPSKEETSALRVRRKVAVVGLRYPIYLKDGTPSDPTVVVWHGNCRNRNRCEVYLRRNPRSTLSSLHIVTTHAEEEVK